MRSLQIAIPADFSVYSPRGFLSPTKLLRCLNLASSRDIEAAQLIACGLAISFRELASYSFLPVRFLSPYSRFKGVHRSGQVANSSNPKIRFGWQRSQLRISDYFS